MTKFMRTAFLAILISGCAKTGRAWVMDESPYLDMFYEGSRFHIGAFILGALTWWWLRQYWSYTNAGKAILAGLAVFSLMSGIGLWRGYDYIHTVCTFDAMRTGDCPAYKSREGWSLHGSPVDWGRTPE